MVWLYKAFSWFSVAYFQGLWSARAQNKHLLSMFAGKLQCEGNSSRSSSSTDRREHEYRGRIWFIVGFPTGLCQTEMNIFSHLFDKHTEADCLNTDNYGEQVLNDERKTKDRPQKAWFLPWSWHCFFMFCVTRRGNSNCNVYFLFCPEVVRW